MFRISFVPGSCSENAHVRIRIGSDDEDKSDANIIVAYCGEKKLEIKKIKNKDYIVLKHVNKGEKVILTVKIANAKRCLLEVSAYA